MQSAFRIVGDDFDQTEKEKISRCVADVREALQSREGAKLKIANEALDAATQHLAAVMVQRAIDQAPAK